MAENPVTVFVKHTVERALKSAAQFSLSTLAGEHLFLHAGFQWQHVAYAAGSGFILSLLTSIASQPIGDPQSPSLVKTVSTDPSVTAPVVQLDVSAVASDALSVAESIFPSPTPGEGTL